MTSEASLARLRIVLRALQRVSPTLAAQGFERAFFAAPRHRPSARGQALLDTGRPFSIGSGNTRVAGWTWGQGPPILLMHGWGDSAGSLHSIARPLIEAGRHVVMFDAPGHGASGRGLSSLPQFIRAIVAVTDYLGDPDVVMAHSLGAAAVMLAAGQGGISPRRFVLFAPPAQPTDLVMHVARLCGLGEESVQRMRRRVARRLDFRWEQLDALAAARRMHAAALVIHDEDDRVVSHGDGIRIAKSWEGAELLSTTGLGHRGVLRDEGVVDRAVRFALDGSVAASWSEPWAGSAARLEYELFDPASR